MIFEDGAGSGNKVKVDEENMAHVLAVEVSAEHHTNHDHGEAYHVIFATSGIIDGAPFLYMKNTDDKDMIVEGYRLHPTCDAKVIIVKDPTVTTVTGDTNTPANINLGVGLAADGTFTTAMSGAISGVIGGTVLDRKFYCSGCEDSNVNFECDVIVPKNKEIVWFTECCSGCNIAGVIPIYFHA